MQCWGAHFWIHRTLRGQNGGTHQKRFQNFWFKSFIKSIYEKSNTFQPLLNIHFRAFGDVQSCGSFGPPPPGSQRVKKSLMEVVMRNTEWIIDAVGMREETCLSLGSVIMLWNDRSCQFGLHLTTPYINNVDFFPLTKTFCRALNFDAPFKASKWSAATCRA